MKNDNNIENFISNLQELIDAKKLLDDVLRYYDIYKCEFQKLPDYERGFRDYHNPTLDQRIRTYKGFNDSE